MKHSHGKQCRVCHNWYHEDLTTIDTLATEKRIVLDDIYGRFNKPGQPATDPLSVALRNQRIRESVQNEMVSTRQQNIRRSGRNETVGKGSKTKRQNYVGKDHGRCQEFYPD